MHTFHIPVYDEMKRRDADLYGRLEQAGFMLDFGVDGSGLFMKYLRRGSGYYIDVGASELVANGSIKLKSRVNIERINPKSVTLTDGSELPCRRAGLRHRLRLDEPVAGRPDLTRGGRPRRQGLGPGQRHTQGPRPLGKASCATCGSPPRCRTCGSTAATCTRAGTTRSSCRCSSRRGWRASPRRSTDLKGPVDLSKDLNARRAGSP
jgi:hypothetical protein